MPVISSGSPPAPWTPVSSRLPAAEAASPPAIAVAGLIHRVSAGAVIVPAATPRPIGANSSAEANGE